MSHRTKHKHAQKRRLQLTLLISSFLLLSTTGLSTIRLIWTGLQSTESSPPAILEESKSSTSDWVD
jgi:hypothetical protein